MSGWVARLCLSLALLLIAGSAEAQLAAGTYPAILTVSSTGEVTYEVRTTVSVPIYTLEIVVSGTGTPVPNAGSHVFQSGSIVALNTTSGGFVSWTGTTGCAGGQSHSITMDGNKRCVVTFSP